MQRATNREKGVGRKMKKKGAVGEKEWVPWDRRKVEFQTESARILNFLILALQTIFSLFLYQRILLHQIKWYLKFIFKHLMKNVLSEEKNNDTDKKLCIKKYCKHKHPEYENRERSRKGFHLEKVEERNENGLFITSSILELFFLFLREQTEPPRKIGNVC